MSTEPTSLQSELSEFAAQFASRVPAEVREVMDQTGRDLEQWFAGQTPIVQGDKAPNFALPKHDGTTWQLSDALNEGPVVLSFYRGGWCPYCNLELRALQAHLPALESAGASLVAVSPQTPDASLSTQEKNELTFDVLSDLGNEVAKQFGLVFELPEELRPVYEGFGIDLPASNGDSSFSLPVPATYVIGTDAVIRYAFVNIDYRTRAEPSDILQQLGS